VPPLDKSTASTCLDLYTNREAIYQPHMQASEHMRPMHHHHHHQAPFDILDLKIRMPPNMTSKFNIMHASPAPFPTTTTTSAPTVTNASAASAANHPHHHTNLSGHYDDDAHCQPLNSSAHEAEVACSSSSSASAAVTTGRVLSGHHHNDHHHHHHEPSHNQKLYSSQQPAHSFPSSNQTAMIVVAVSGLCLAPLFWIVSLHAEDNTPELLERRAKQGACFFLMMGPLALPTLMTCHFAQQKGQWLTLVSGCCSLMLGNAAAVLYCTGYPYPSLKMWLMSGALIVAALQKLWMVHKGNALLLMLSTAAAVVVCCLAAVAPLLPSLVMTYRCFESTAIPMLWLCWQASAVNLDRQKAKMPLPSHSHAV
jgi:hypothetical protein